MKLPYFHINVIFISCNLHLHAQIVDALRHMPSCIEYMQQLKHTMVFRFCAIPQIMAAGTLAACYNNGKVFEGKYTAPTHSSCAVHTSLFTILM